MNIIGLSGKKRSGKNTAYMLSKLLLDEDETGAVVKVAFADALKRMARGPPYFWNGQKDTDGRRLLQDLGVRMRETRGKNFWVSQWKDEVYRLGSLAHPPRVLFVTDCRFINEANTIREMGGEVWRIARPDIVSVDHHVSETELDDYPWFNARLIHTTLDELFTQLKRELQRLGLYEG